MDEKAIYELLVELVRRRGVGRLVIESSYANVTHVVNFAREENGIDPAALKRVLDTPWRVHQYVSGLPSHPAALAAFNLKPVSCMASVRYPQTDL